MHSTTRLNIEKRQIANTQLDTLPAVALAPGQARLQIERVALTANNISYAATGDLLQYWQFFPVDATWGSLPAWGFARVSESLCEDLQVGERIWGFLPVASELVVQPVKASAHGFTDGIARRTKLPMVYNEYMRCATDPMHRDGFEDVEALLRPLFSTGWLVDDYFFDNQFFGAEVAVISSASSKTAYSTAFQMHQRAGVEVVGLTAPRNKAFVASLGCYHRVLGYDELDQLQAQRPSVYLDYAGDAALRQKVHEHLPELRHSSSIGASHIEKIGGSSGLPGPKPQFLFVPHQAAKRVGEWGLAGLMQRMAQDWQRLTARALDTAQPWIQVQHHEGGAATQAAYATVLAGQGDARLGHIVSMANEGA